MRIVVVLSLGGMLALSCGGCQQFKGLFGKGKSESPEPNNLKGISKMSAEKLRVDLRRFADNFAAGVAGTADTIARQTTDPRIRELTLLWKLRVIPVVQKVVLAEDPRYGFLDSWAITIHMRRSLEKGETSFGDQQHLAIETAKGLEKDIERIGTQFLSPETLESTKKQIEQFVEGAAVSGEFASHMVRASEAARSTFGDFSGVLSIPISGLSDSAVAIDQLAQVAEVFTQVIQDIPERTRWQTELLLLQLESQIPLGDALRNWGNASESLKSIAATAEAMPGDVRKELQVLIESTDEKQTNLQKTLQDTTKAAEAVNAVLTTIEGMSSDDDEAATATEKTDEGEDSSFDINEYTRAADAIRSGSIEVRSLLEEIESGKLNKSVAAIGETADLAINRAADRSTALVDRITYRVLLVIGVFFSALLLYRLTARKLKLGKLGSNT